MDSKLKLVASQDVFAELAQRVEAIHALWVTYELEWYDIFEFETLILQLQSFETIKRRTWDLREKYKQMVAPATYEAYMRSNPPDPVSKDPDTERLLRGDLSKLLDEFHWRYGLALAREAARANISLWLAGIQTVVVLASVGFIFWWHNWPDTYPPFPVAVGVFITGMIGGFVSTQRRLQNSKPSGAEPIEELVQLNQGKIGVVTAPLLGGIFAVVLYVIFAGQFLKGDVFPMIPGKVDIKRLEDFWTTAGPADVLNGAKLLIWSFLAGFAERLVPDALDRIAATNTDKKSS